MQQPEPMTTDNDTSLIRSTTTPPASGFTSLPTEILLIVLKYLLPNRRMLLDFRLVSSYCNHLVLDSTFWSRICFSKRDNLILKTVGSKHGPVATLGQGLTSGSGSGLNLRPLHHHSDAHTVLYRYSWAAAVLDQGADHSNAPPSLFISSNNRALGNEWLQVQGLSSSSQVDEESLESSWIEKQTSFILFLKVMAERPILGHGVAYLLIEDFTDEALGSKLWSVMRRLRGLRELTIQRSAFRSLVSDPITPRDTPQPQQHHADSCDAMSNQQFPAWKELTRLELKDCDQLSELTSLYSLAPHLEDLSLEKCAGIDDFSTLFVEGSPPESTNSNSTNTGSGAERRLLSLRRLCLNGSRVRDKELIQMLYGAPHLKELRLDQCYLLTAASLAVIGHSSHREHTSLSLGDHARQQKVQEVSKPIDEADVPQLELLSLRECYDLSTENIRVLAGCRKLETLIIRGLRHVDEGVLEWLHSQGVPLRKALGPLGKWSYWK